MQLVVKILAVDSRKRSSVWLAGSVKEAMSMLYCMQIGRCGLDLPKSGAAMADLAALLPMLCVKHMVNACVKHGEFRGAVINNGQNSHWEGEKQWN